MENRSVNQDSHLVRAEIEKDLKSMNCARGGRRGGSGWQLKFGGDGLLPL